MEVVHQADSWIHLFVMTSDKNNDATIAFLKEHDFFGYNAEYVHFFKQEMAAATDYEGKIYLEEKGKLSTSPNGNGGWFISMKTMACWTLYTEKALSGSMYLPWIMYCSESQIPASSELLFRKLCGRLQGGPQECTG